MTLATCFGRYLYLGVDSNLKSPYQAYISASREVKNYEVIESFNSLFEVLIECGDLIHAYLEQEKTNSPFYYKDSLTTFKDHMTQYRNEKLNDPEYRKTINSHPEIQAQLAKGKVTQAVLDLITEKAFRDIVIKHSEAFNFPECD